MKKFLILFVSLVILPIQLLLSQEETGQHPILTDRFQLGAGIYIPAQKVKFGVDGKSDNQAIEFDKTFDFNNNRSTPNISFDWRFANKWRLGAEYFNVSYATKAVLEDDIIAGDYTFSKGSNVGVGYKINLYRIFVGHVIWSELKHELGGGLGVHILDVNPYIEGNIIVNDGDNKFQKVAGSATAPLPNIALWYYFAPTEKWAFTAKVDWFALSVDQYSGSLWDVAPGIRYQIIKNMGVSLDYRFFDLRADVDQNRWNGSFEMSFSGPSITLFGNL